MLNIDNSLVQSIKNHGEIDYPYECCGIILGNFEKNGIKIAKELIPIENARSDEHKHNRFLITPKELVKAELYARKKSLDVIGFYHSHPDHPSKPSEYDREHAWPKYSYIIISVDTGISQIFSSWELEDNREYFNEEKIDIIGGL